MTKTTYNSNHRGFHSLCWTLMHPHSCALTHKYTHVIIIKSKIKCKNVITTKSMRKSHRRIKVCKNLRSSLANWVLMRVPDVCALYMHLDEYMKISNMEFDHWSSYPSGKRKSTPQSHPLSSTSAHISSGPLLRHTHAC